MWQLSFDLNLKENNPMNPSVWKAFQNWFLYKNWIGINSYNSYNVNGVSLWGPCKKNHTLCLQLWGIKVEAIYKLHTYRSDDIVGFILWFTTITCWFFQWKNSRDFCFDKVGKSLLFFYIEKIIKKFKSDEQTCAYQWY